MEGVQQEVGKWSLGLGLRSMAIISYYKLHVFLSSAFEKLKELHARYPEVCFLWFWQLILTNELVCPYSSGFLSWGSSRTDPESLLSQKGRWEHGGPNIFCDRVIKFRAVLWLQVTNPACIFGLLRLFFSTKQSNDCGLRTLDVFN